MNHMSKQKMFISNNLLRQLLRCNIFSLCNGQTLLCLFLLSWFTIFDLTAQTDVYDSGGALMPEQAAFDVTFYDLSLRIDPTQKSIEGTLKMKAKIVHPTALVVLNLDSLLDITTIHEINKHNQVQCNFYRKASLVYIPLQQTRQAGEQLQLSINYGGQPRVAPRPPWNGGFTWEKTTSGQHWIATTCQQEGADVWWPNKDHVSDKPDSVALHIRVPQPLVVATNGHLKSVETHDNAERTYHWFVSTPISNYNVALNIAPYKLIETDVTSVSGAHFPFVFYVLPEDYEKGEALFPEMIEHLHFYEKHFGPYPFRKDKYGVVQTPHLGMEHQSIIAYGAKFSNKTMTNGRDWGFDALHHHELAHEWWGNLVTNSDWRDMWLHEGFGSYMQALYVEELSGKEKYRDYMTSIRRFANTNSVAPRKATTAREIYRAPIYTKGAWILHTLRFVIGDKAFFKAMRLMAYPDPKMEEVNDGRHIRFATTDDFLHIAEKTSGMELDWFFELYLRQPKIPTLHFKRTDTSLDLHWESPAALPFPMPLEISTNRQIRRYEIPAEGLSIPLEKGAEFLIDPNYWVLKEIAR